ncbi:MAG: glycosyltransferase family 39 protein [Terriglobales bacterium]|jgi:hypothetical protein
MLAPAPQRENSHPLDRRTWGRWSVRHAAFFFVFAISAWYAAANLNRGWVPHDDGALAQSAERVMHGELPHRDFNEIYTGALDYPHALAFMLFGTTFTSLRLVLFAAFLLWLPVVYRVALFSGPPWVAAAVSLLAAAWSIPNYSASMPSWYNLFLATGAALCLLQYANHASRRMGWLFLAGVCCGVSIIVKITGVYALAAALLACVYLRVREGRAQEKTNRTYLVFVVAFLLIFLVAVFRTLGARANANELFAFLLPCALLSYLLVRRIASAAFEGGITPFLQLARAVGPLVLGTLIPIALFVAPYFWSHSTRALYNGTLVAPFRRVNVTVADSTEVLRTWPALVLIGLLLTAAHFRLRKTLQVLIAATGACFLYVSADSPPVLQLLWRSLFDVVPYLVLAITIWTIVADRKNDQHEQLFVLLAFVAVCNLSRFPFSGPIYFCYIAPLVFLTIQSWLEQMPKRSPAVLLVALVFFLLFSAIRIKPSFLVEMGADYVPDRFVTPFHVERARGIRSQAGVVDVYEEITKLVQEHAGDKGIYAGPDAPEIYFLTGKRNPTRDIFNFLNDNALTDVNAALDRGDINLVVWNRGPQFSHNESRELQQRIESDYPYVQHVAAFDVRWR